MAKLIIIRATQQSGKTTTAGIVYQELLKYADKSHSFNNENVENDNLKYGKDGETIDFIAVLTVNGQKIGLISEGDIARSVKEKIEILLKIDVAVIICCARSIDRVGSTYRMMKNDYSKTHPIAFEIFTEYSNDEKLKFDIKKEIVDKVVAKTLSFVKYNTNC